MLTFSNCILGLDGGKEDYRLRRLVDNELYVVEELGTIVRHMEHFEDGGVRLLLEKGRAPRMEEVALIIRPYKISNQEEDFNFYFRKDLTLREAREAICSKLDVDIAKFQLWQVDGFEEARQCIRKDKSTLGSTKLRSGDLLILKSDDDLSLADKIVINAHRTLLGVSEDVKHVG